MMLKKYMASFLSAVMLLGVVPVFAAEVEKKQLRYVEI